MLNNLCEQIRAICEIAVSESAKTRISNLVEHASATGLSQGEWLAFIDDVALRENHYNITGWAKKKICNESRFISVGVNNQIIFNCFLADLPRPDVQNAGLGSGFYGFNLYVDAGLFNAPINLITIVNPENNVIIAFKVFCI